MFTPQQLSEIGFTKAVFGGYDMESVHDVLDLLISDYTTLYKENAVLKSKLRILVEKLEEYRNMEASGALSAKAEASAGENARELIRDAEEKAAAIIREAREHAATILGEANSSAKVRAGAAIELEEDRLAQAKQAAASFIQAMEADIHHHLELLDNLKLLELTGDDAQSAPQPTPKPQPAPKPQSASKSRSAQPPAPESPAPKPVVKPLPKPVAKAKSVSKPAHEAPPPSDDIAKEIEQNLEKLVGSVPNASTFDSSNQDTKVMRPLHPESITAKFGDLQFGKNYNPK